MAELTGKTIISPKEFSIKDQPESDAPAQVDDHGVLFPAGSSKAKLSQSDQTGIVLYPDSHTHLVHNVLANVRFPFRQKRIVHPFFRVHKTRHTDTDANYLVLCDSRPADMLRQSFRQYFQR